MGQDYAEGFDRAFQLAGTALAYMKKKKIPANPHNFHVWYEYFLGTNPKLKAKLQPLIQVNATITDQMCAELYETCISPPEGGEDVEAWSQRMNAVVKDIDSVLAQTGGDAETYREALTVFSGDLEIAKNTSDIQEKVLKMTRETRQMAQRVAQLQAQVQASSDQVAKLNGELTEARADALTDGLTAIANRKYFDATLADAMISAAESDTPLALVIIDLDHFKRFNDTYGHTVGDQILRVIARTLRGTIKGRDLAARYGGEEFALILPETDLEGAAAVAENIRHSVSMKRLKVRDSDTPIEPLTLSLGVATYIEGDTASSFIDRADKALYKAKHGGRNRVVAESGSQKLVLAG